LIASPKGSITEDTEDIPPNSKRVATIYDDDSYDASLISEILLTITDKNYWSGQNQTTDVKNKLAMVLYFLDGDVNLDNIQFIKNMIKSCL
jgi:hypothetical protein